MGGFNFGDMEDTVDSVGSSRRVNLSKSMPAQGEPRSTEWMPAPQKSLLSDVLGNNLIDDVTRCAEALKGICDSFARYGEAQEQTKRAVVRYQADIEKSRQETEQVRIKQAEKTNRHMMQIQKDIEADLRSLEKIQAKLVVAKRKNDQDHEEVMQALADLRPFVKSEIESISNFHKTISDSTQEIEARLRAMNSIDHAITELNNLAKHLTSLPAGKSK